MEIIIAGAFSLLAGLVANSPLFQRLLQWILTHVLREKKVHVKPASFSERIAALTEQLSRASASFDSVIGELSRVAEERTAALKAVETELLSRETRSKELEQRIRDLEGVPLAVAEHFAKLTQPGERRSAMRDYVLFGAGVIVSTVIAILLKVAGWG